MDKKYLSVLLIEDDHDDQFFFKDALHRLDPEISLTIASNGLEAFEYLKKHKPSIIFLDINMPGMGGKECLRRIRSNPELGNVILVMFTTSSSEEDIDECFAFGAHLYVVKPLSQLENINILKRILFLHLDDQIPPPTRQTFVFDAFVRPGSSF